MEAHQLSTEECFVLGRRWREQGDRGARDQLILAHLPMARIAAAMIRPLRWMTDEDLEAEAYAILVRQADRWEPERGVPFRAWIALQLRGLLWTKVRNKIPQEEVTLISEEPDGWEHAVDSEKLDDTIAALLARTDDVGAYARALAEGEGIQGAARAVFPRATRATSARAAAIRAEIRQALAPLVEE